MANSAKKSGSLLPKTAAKPKNTKKVLSGLFQYMKQYKSLFLLALLLTILGNIFALLGPTFSGKAIDAMSQGKGKVDFDTLFLYAALMVIFYILSFILTYLLALLMLHISQKIVMQMRNDVFSKLLDLPVSYYDQNMTGDILSRISYDIDVVNTSMSTDLVQILASLITVIGSFFMMMFISPVLVLVMLVTIPMSILYTRYMAKKTRPLFLRRSQKLGETNGFVEEMVTGQKTIRAYAREADIMEKFNQKNKDSVEAYYNAEYYGSITGPTVNFINNISLSLVTVFGAMLYLYGHMSLGQISSFVLYSRKFSGPINEAANIITDLQSALAAAERVFRVLNEESEPADIDGALDLVCPEGNVKMEDVTFGYLKNKIILNKLSLQVKKGGLIAIVGPTGAGKTTIINLLMRFYDPNTGTIRVDNQDIKDLTRASLRKSYAMVLQDTWIFRGTVYENIAYGKESVTMEEVVAAAKASRIHSYINRLPDGYQTVLNDDGMNISKGQLQLLTIARAMLPDANMLILDEATSNVDTRTEIQIQKAMRQLMEGKTCFVIAHRLSTIQHADLILVIDSGSIVEQGTHDSLMKQKGYYYGFYRSQFE